MNDASRQSDKFFSSKTEMGLVLWYIKFEIIKGPQWLSGRVLDSRPRGCGFKPHRRHCVVVLEQDTFILA